MKRDLIISLFVLVGNIVLYISLRWMEEPRSVTFPKVIITIMIILSGLLLLQSLLVKKRSGSEKPFPLGRAALCFFMIIVYFAVMEFLGFYFSSFLFYIAVTFVLAGKDLDFRKGAVRVGVSFVFMAVLFVLFNKILAVQTPKGILF